MKMYWWIRGHRATINGLLGTIFTGLFLNTISEARGNVFSDFGDILRQIVEFKSLSGFLTLLSLAILITFNSFYMYMRFLFEKHSGSEDDQKTYINSKEISLINSNKSSIDADCLIQKYDIKDFLKVVDKYESSFMKAFMHCSCRWGTCVFDETAQNTNTCEGILAILSSKYKDIYREVIHDRFDYLLNEVTDLGLISKSLSEETVVPTAMFLLLCKILKINNSDILLVANNLWNSRTVGGWGLYVREMENHTNIGCTYWALIGLKDFSNIQEDEYQKFLRFLFKYEEAYLYGNTIDNVSPRIPCLYATSMMYILYSLLSEESKNIIETRYNPGKALEYILENFDNPFYLVEQEGIDGVETKGKTSVHTVNWNHISINYSLTALSIAIRNKAFTLESLKSVLARVERILVDNCQEDRGVLLWLPPKMDLNKGSRGNVIFPSMHLLMGLTNIRNALLELDNQ